MIHGAVDHIIHCTGIFSKSRPNSVKVKKIELKLATLYGVSDVKFKQVSPCRVNWKVSW